MGRQVEELIEGYGIETLAEMLDLFEIMGEEPVAWRNFALKYQIIKKTTKIITPRLAKHHITTRRQGNYDLYYIVLENGRGQWVFEAKFTNLDMETWREQYG